MPEESTFHDNQSGTAEASEKEKSDGLESSRQDIFAAKFNALSDEFGRYCEENNIKHAAIIATDGELQPMIFSNSDLLTTAAVLAAALRPMKEEINAMTRVD